MTKSTLQDIILNAMTNQTSPAQPAGFETPDAFEEFLDNLGSVGFVLLGRRRRH